MRDAHGDAQGGARRGDEAAATTTGAAAARAAEQLQQVPAAAGAAAAAAAARGKASEAAASGGRAPAPRVHARQIAWLTVIILLFALGLSGSVILWQTRLWDDYIDSQITIRNDTPAYKRWAESEVTTTLKFWVFNYTNVDEFVAGDASKLRLQETGPYAFRERVHRVNAIFHGNGSVSYNEQREYTFVPEQSNGTLDDKINSLNTVLISMNYVAQHMTYLERLPLWSILSVIKPTAVETRTARELFLGYNDTLKSIAELREGRVKAGIIESSSGTDPDRLTVHTGVGDMSKLGEISHYNGMEQMNFYSTEECNRVDGSDGVRFPPPKLRPGARLVVYHREACRRVPLVFDREVTVWDDVPALRFRTPTTLFNNGDDSPENQCYCKKTLHNKCYPSGVINTHHCRKGAPMFASFPHFLFGDEILTSKLEGLNPDPVRHLMYLDVHARIGATVAVASRFQMNFLVKNLFEDPFMRKANDLILPWIWMERSMDAFPDDLRATFRLVSFTAPAAHTALRWGCPLLALATGLVLLVCLYVEVAALLRPGPYAQDVQMTRL